MTAHSRSQLEAALRSPSKQAAGLFLLLLVCLHFNSKIVNGAQPAQTFPAKGKARDLELFSCECSVEDVH